jgi:peptidoglycan/LPS O-acetylase OafA/YrhL
VNTQKKSILIEVLKDHVSKLDSIQSLRFFAASLVVITHITLNINERVFGRVGEYWMSGSSGVDIFFVISGFIMAYTTKVGGYLDWLKFISRRFIRIVPLYWIATTLKVLLVFAFIDQTHYTKIDSSHIFASFAFISYYVMGKLDLPVVPAGWTLNYEMFYYLVFTTALFLKCRPLIFCSIIFLLLVLCGKLLVTSGGISFYSNPLIIEFVFGMMLAKILTREPARFDLYVGVLLIITGIGIIFFVAPSDWVLHNRWLVWGGAGAALVSGLVLIENKGFSFFQKWAIRLGDSSYSLYLFHAMVIPAVIMICSKLFIRSYELLFLLSASASLIVSYCIHIFVEKPMTQKLRANFKSLNLIANI